MTRQALRRLAVAACALAAVVAPAAGAAQAPGVIRLVSVTTSIKEIDRPPRGASTGDSVRETSRLLNEVAQFGKPRRAVVGSDRAVQRLRLSPRSLTVDGVATLPGGTLRFRGTVERAAQGGIVIPVVAGTGRYLGARGILFIVTVQNPERTLNIYRLTYARFA